MTRCLPQPNVCVFHKDQTNIQHNFHESATDIILLILPENEIY